MYIRVGFECTEVLELFPERYYLLCFKVRPIGKRAHAVLNGQIVRESGIAIRIVFLEKLIEHQDMQQLFLRVLGISVNNGIIVTVTLFAKIERRYKRKAPKRMHVEVSGRSTFKRVVQIAQTMTIAKQLTAFGLMPEQLEKQKQLRAYIRIRALGASTEHTVGNKARFVQQHNAFVIKAFLTQKMIEQ